MNAIADKDSMAQKPRILFLIDEIGGITEGGTERQVLQLVVLSKRLGYEPNLAVLRGTEWLSEEQAGCPLYFAGVRSFFRPSGWRACLKLVGWMRRERITVVQTFFIESNILGPWLARLAGVPVVISSRRNLNQWHNRTRWMGPLIHKTQRLSNVSTDCIVANSRVAAESTQKLERIPQHKLQVAYNGIDLAKFSGLQQGRHRARQLLGIAEDEILVGNISCMRLAKGIHQFVDAARLVLEKEPRMRFLVVGEGTERPYVVERIQRYGLEDRIHLVGAQTDVMPYLAAMDIGVLSSLTEGFSNSLLEYMAAGLPAVATDVGGNREALEGTGFLVPPDEPAALAEAILRLRSPELRRQLGEAARRRAQRFGLEQAERRMSALYREMLTLKGNLQQQN